MSSAGGAGDTSSPLFSAIPHEGDNDGPSEDAPAEQLPAAATAQSVFAMLHANELISEGESEPGAASGRTPFQSGRGWNNQFSGRSEEDRDLDCPVDRGTFFKYMHRLEYIVALASQETAASMKKSFRPGMTGSTYYGNGPEPAPSSAAALTSPGLGARQFTKHMSVAMPSRKAGQGSTTSQFNPGRRKTTHVLAASSRGGSAIAASFRASNPRFTDIDRVSVAEPSGNGSGSRTGSRGNTVNPLRANQSPSPSSRGDTAAHPSTSPQPADTDDNLRRSTVAPTSMGTGNGLGVPSTTSSSEHASDKDSNENSGRSKDDDEGGPAAGDLTVLLSFGLPQTHLFVIVMDTLFLLSTMTAAAAPYQAAIQGYDNLSDVAQTLTHAAALVSQVLYLVFIASRFFVRYRRGWEMFDALRDIRRVYFDGWFRFDVLLALPLDWIFLGWAPQIFFYCQLRMGLRYIRAFSLQASNNPLQPSRMWVGLCNQLTLIGVAHHIAAVVFGRMQSLDYVDAVYWAATTTSSVGYGDITPHSDSASQRGWAILIMVLGLVIVASVTGFVTSLFTAKDALQEAIDAKKQMLGAMMEYYEIPWSVQTEVISMFPAVIDAGNQVAFKALIQDLPHFLVTEIEGYTRARALSTAIPLFEDCSSTVRLEVAQRLVHRFHQANEPIIVAGEEGFEMYFLVRGVADVIITRPDGDNLVVATLRSGSFFGEVALVSESVKRTASIVPVSPSEVLVLSKQNFEELGREYPEVRTVFETVIAEAQARVRASKK